MEAKMQLLDYYITKYDFEVKRKIMPTEQLSMNGKLGYKVLNAQEENDKKIIGLEIQNEIILFNKNNEKEELGKIVIRMDGVFSFDKSCTKKEIDQLLKVNGMAVLYGQLRSYITTNTALSGSVSNIILPLLNFVEKSQNS